MYTFIILASSQAVNSIVLYLALFRNKQNVVLVFILRCVCCLTCLFLLSCL